MQHFLGKEVDIVTPNGFEDSFVPASEIFEERRNSAREKLINVAEAVLGYSAIRRLYINGKQREI